MPRSKHPCGTPALEKIEELLNQAAAFASDGGIHSAMGLVQEAMKILKHEARRRQKLLRKNPRAYILDRANPHTPATTR